MHDTLIETKGNSISFSVKKVYKIMFSLFVLQRQYLRKTLGQASQKGKASSLSLPFFSQQLLGFLLVPISQETWRYVVFLYFCNPGKWWCHWSAARAIEVNSDHNSLSMLKPKFLLRVPRNLKVLSFNAKVFNARPVYF